MSNIDFSYLNKFISKDGNHNVFGNLFISLNQDYVHKAEMRLGFVFPSELRDFYLSIGYGYLICKEGQQEECEHDNRIMGPNSIADILLLGVDSGQLHPDAEFEPWEMPFFEIGDGASFLVMHPKSEHPNAVYNMLGEKITDHFSDFIWRLYHESPSFYLKEEESF